MKRSWHRFITRKVSNQYPDAAVYLTDIRHQFEILQPQRHWANRQNEGSELDLESHVNFLADRQHGQINNDVPIYRNLPPQNRDLSCLLLADLSLSTDAYVNNQSRVIDVIRDSLYLLQKL